MAIFKITHLFNMCRNGWSETWYTDATDRTQARLRGEGMALARIFLLGEPGLIEAQRVTALDVNRSCGIEPLTGYDGLANLLADVPWNGWLIEVQASGGYCRFWVARGMPDAWIVRNEDSSCNFLLPGSLETSFNLFKPEFLLQSPYLRVILDPPEGPAPIDITGPPVVGANGNTQFPIAGLVGAAGKRVKFTNWLGPDKKLLNGVFDILANTGANVTVRMPFSSILIPGDNSGGRAWAQVIGFKVIENVRLVRPSSRATGRAFFVRRGRRARRT